MQCSAVARALLETGSNLGFGYPAQTDVSQLALTEAQHEIRAGCFLGSSVLRNQRLGAGRCQKKNFAAIWRMRAEFGCVAFKVPKPKRPPVPPNWLGRLMTCPAELKRMVELKLAHCG